MGIWEVALVAVALSMDAFAAGMTDGMAAPRMSAPVKAAIAAAFGLFQFLMPVIGYYAGSAFSSVFERVAPWLSFVLLAFIGGRSVLSCLAEQRRGQLRSVRAANGKPTVGKVLAQAVATSLDALAAGVAMLAAEMADGLPFPFPLCALFIGLTTYLLSAIAIETGERAGARYADRAELLGGFILLLVGLKILLEGVL